jgi:hypothetical protein
MQARTTFGEARISKGVVAVFVALLLAAFLAGGASGLFIKGLSLPAATATGASQVYSLSDASTSSHRGGPQTIEEQSPNRATGSETGPRHSGLQIP